jgi:ubiquinone/menaquinone biosynthesis C-methylase UbiE
MNTHPLSPQQNLPFIAKLWWRLISLGFRLLYNEMAWTYDLVAWVVSLGQWHNWQRAALHHLNTNSGDRVLELAHGTGNLQLDLFSAGYQRIGLDISPFMGHLAGRKLRKHHLKSPLVRGRAQYLPFPDNSFDAIVSTFPTPFIIESETLAEAHRILKQGKRLVIVPSGVLTGGGLLKQGLEFAYRVTGQRGPWGIQLEDHFLNAGFSVEMVVQKCPYSVAYVIIATRL